MLPHGVVWAWAAARGRIWVCDLAVARVRLMSMAVVTMEECADACGVFNPS